MKNVLKGRKTMRKQTIMMLIACGIAGCTPELSDTIEFDYACADKEVKLSNDEMPPTCAVHLQLAYATDRNGDKADVINSAIQKEFLDMGELTMQQAVDSFASSYASSYIKNFLPLYNQDRSDTTKRSWYNYHYVITTQTQPGGKSTTAYIATIDYFEGGAHGINQQKIMTFDNKTGHRVLLDDMFVSGYEGQLSAFLQEALCEKTGAESLKDLREQGYLFSMDMFPAKNFIFNDETITFIYNPYEIASYDKGSTELTLPLSTLSGILKQEYRP